MTSTGGQWRANAGDLDEIATALSDQDSYEHRYLVNRKTGEIVFWTVSDEQAQRRLARHPRPWRVPALQGRAT
ncbi:hypothetical protein RB614_02985 [Phytohabitans sp. ZYX-F-186]|uniref:Uncharacterized protein n=1 Tax=Phytohabitans maris TaxID=3071409 RepID=A0ABU0Z8V7_9ACTN|nr:hypothetical protein [Phytohabitans sp. ZYX-F-186]MDQ7903478.1 hypothetical protein [Phytohabitans sp. ZYX-F-186]